MDWPANARLAAIRWLEGMVMTNQTADDETVERVAQFLHDEGGFDEAWSESATWPEHPDDTGQREGGYVRIVPSDVQAKFRDVARRLCLQFPKAAIAAMQPVVDGEEG